VIFKGDLFASEENPDSKKITNFGTIFLASTGLDQDQVID
jgi:hypothetical protein